MATAIEAKTLLDFLLDLINDRDALADFRDDPQGALQDAGLGDVSVADIKCLLPVILEKIDAAKCAQYEDDCDDDDCYDSAPKHHGDHCRPVHCDDDGRPSDHTSELDKVAAHLNYVTNNYSYDSHDTNFTTNNITKVWADHSTVDVSNQTQNVGEGGVAVGGDNLGDITAQSGHHNILGDGNQMSGDGSTTAFGDGAATSLDHVGTGDGGAINVGSGEAAGNFAPTETTLNNDDGTASIGGNATDDHTSTHVVDASDNSTDNSVDNSHQDNSTDASTNDSGNTSFDHLADLNF